MNASINSSSFWSISYPLQTQIELKDEQQWKQVVYSNLSIFCVIGPPNSGKDSTARLLAECTEYRVLATKETRKSSSRLKVKQNFTTKEIIESFLKEIKISYRFCPGYILVGFPRNVQEAALFEKQVKQPNVIIYLTLTLDGLLARTAALDLDADLFDFRVSFVESLQNNRKIVKKYLSNIIKIQSYYPIEDVINKILASLEDEFGYKFKRLTTKDNYFKTLNNLN